MTEEQTQDPPATPPEGEKPVEAPPPQEDKSFAEKVRERAAGPQEEVKKPDPPPAESTPDPPKEAKKGPEAAIIAERRKWQKREKEFVSRVEALEAQIAEIKKPAPPAPEKNEEAEFIAQNQDDPLVKMNLRLQRELDEVRAQHAAHNSHIEEVKNQETNRWLDDSLGNLEKSYAKSVPEIFKPNPTTDSETGEETTSRRFDKFVEHMATEAPQEAFSSPEAFEREFKMFFFDELVAAREKAAREEVLSRKIPGERQGIIPPQQVAGTPSAFQKTGSFAQRVRERAAAMTSG